MDITPKSVYIQMTNMCNNRCTICIYGNNPDCIINTHHMSSSVIEKILDNLQDLDSIKTVFFGPMYGEAQLHPNFYEFVDKIKNIRSDITITLLTNGKLITDDNINKFKGDHIQISVLGDKTGPNSYKNITGLNWEDLKKKAVILNRYGKKYGFSLHMSTLTDVEEAIVELSELPGFQAIYRTREINDIKDYLVRCKYLNLKYPVRLNDDLHTFDNDIVKLGLTDISFNNGYQVCHQVYDVVTVTVNGDVLICPCELAGVCSIGNVLEEKIIKIYNSSIMKNARLLISQKRFSSLNPCAKLCGYKS